MIDFYDSPEWLDARYKALKKAKGFCECCGSRGTPDNVIQVDHVLPRSKFPKLALDQSNLQVLCRRCNLGKSNKDGTDWRVEPSRELLILNQVEPAKRFRLQQLGWLRLNGDSPQIRIEAHRAYRGLWREIEVSWLSQQAAE
jgi:hypothetical protein